MSLNTPRDPKDPLRSQPFTPQTLQNAKNRGPIPRNQYAANSRIPRRADPEGDVNRADFPPHPSIRVPANVKASVSPRMPMGVGVAPRPTREVPAAYQQDKAARLPAQANTPKSAWDQSQDLARAETQSQTSMRSPPPVPPQPQTARRYNMTQSYVSSINDDTPPLRQQLPPRESHYPEDESPRPAYPSSKIMPQFEFSTPDNRATMDTIDSYDQFNRRAKPKLVDTSLRPSTKPKPGEISPASTRANAMNALSQAIQVGISKPVSPATNRDGSPMRMPFDNDANSVRSGYTTDLEPPDLKDAPPMPIASVKWRRPEEGTSPKSVSSESPILGLGIGGPARGMSTKRDVTKRPPRLDIDAVREMEARGSTTSLTDLIKRATRLASNLDRGKTASRLGMLDMFGASSSSQGLNKLPPGKRDSSMSDMLSAFPAPAAGTPRSEWPMNEKGFMSSTTNLSRKKGDGSSSKRRKGSRRRICGMTVPCFTVVLIALILLIAAAVLIPIFLIVVPRQSNNSGTAAASLSACSRDDASKCQNGGQQIFTDGACGCVCTGGFIGKNCETQGGNTCTTEDVADGSVVYRDATMSQEVLQGFRDAVTFNVPLNVTTILGLFSENAVTCADASSMVDVNESNNKKRSAAADPEPLPIVMIPGLEPSEVVQPLHIPHPTQAPTPTTFVVSKRQAFSTSSSPLFSEVDGVVFDPTRGSFVSSGTADSSGTATSFGSSAAASTADAQAAGSNISQQLAFSRVVVLYVAERSRSVSTALDARSRLSRFFSTSGDGDQVTVGQVTGSDLEVDMTRFTIRDGDQTVGGGGGS